MLSVSEAPGTTVVCPHCRSAVLVPSLGPAAGAGTSRPAAAPPMARPQARPAPPGAPQPPTPEQQQAEEESTLITVMGAAMPWAVSFVFHVGLGLLFYFIWFAFLEEGAEPPVVPDANIAVDQGAMNPTPRQQEREHTERRRRRQQETSEARVMRRDTKLIMMNPIGVGTSSGAVPVGDPYRGGGPGSGFFGTAGNARRIVYVVDRSGSMFDTFDYVREELKRSISRLKPMQSFHVIFFSAGEPQENPPKQMVPAVGSYKTKAFEFLGGIVPEGQTKPERAIERAFKVTHKGKHAQLIYLLTDGEFDAEVVGKISRMQASLRTKIKINTIGFVFHAGEKLLQRIADQNGGMYKFVSRDDLGR
jgi:hypothetical protein